MKTYIHVCLVVLELKKIGGKMKRMACEIGGTRIEGEYY